jgi:integrase
MGEKRGGGIRRKKSYKREAGYRQVPLDRETVKLLQEQIARFKEKFGREPGPDDPVFFDPEADIPRPLSDRQMQQAEQNLHEAALKVGINPALVYAMRKTGRIVTTRNRQFLSDEELEEWNNAIDEYHEKMDRGEN